MMGMEEAAAAAEFFFYIFLAEESILRENHEKFWRQKFSRLNVYRKQRETRVWKKHQKKLEFNFAQIICEVTSEKLKI